MVVRLCVHGQLAAHFHRDTRPPLLLRARWKCRVHLPRTVPATILHSAGRGVRRIKYATRTAILHVTGLLTRRFISHLDPDKHPLERQDRHPQETSLSRNLLAHHLYNRLLHHAHIQAPKRTTPRPNLAILLERTGTRNR